MDHKDRALIQKFVDNNKELRRLFKKHLAFEEKLTAFVSRPYLTSSDEMEIKKIKKMKLLGRDRMMSLVGSSNLGSGEMAA